MNPAPPTPFDDPASTWNRRFIDGTYLFGDKPNEWLLEQASA
jgi:hypothetical protein